MFNDFVGHVLLVMLNGRIIKSSTNQPLGGVDGVLRVGDGLSLCGSTYKLFPFLGEGDN